MEPAVGADHCPICTNRFNDSERFPFILIPCTHTICKECKVVLENAEKICIVCNPQQTFN